MDQMEQLQAVASSLLNKAQDASVSELASAFERATGVVRLSSATDAKFAAQSPKNRRVEKPQDPTNPSGLNDVHSGLYLAD